eukprot:6814537-Pyramimonas_sp.AAC.1
MVEYRQQHSFDGIAVFDLCRSPGKVRPVYMRMDEIVPCLTCKNQHIWIEAAHPPLYKRFLTRLERFRLLGLPDDILDNIPTVRAAMRASGNAMALPTVGLVIACTYNGKR